MPGRDGTGPLGYGSRTGGGAGFCAGISTGRGPIKRSFCRGGRPGLGLRCRRFDFIRQNGVSSGAVNEEENKQ